MPKPTDRAMLSRLVDAYDRISEESLSMGDTEFHEIEDQLFDAIVDSRCFTVSLSGNFSSGCFPFLAGMTRPPSADHQGDILI